MEKEEKKLNELWPQNFFFLLNESIHLFFYHFYELWLFVH